MFKTLEEQHQYELQSQYRRHQESIFHMQQEMEDQLFTQQQSLKRKLAAHKEVLSPVKTGKAQCKCIGVPQSREHESSKIVSFYAPSLKGPPGESSNRIVRLSFCLSVRPSVCLSVRNSVPLT